MLSTFLFHWVKRFAMKVAYEGRIQSSEVDCLSSVSKNLGSMTSITK